MTDPLADHSDPHRCTMNGAHWVCPACHGTLEHVGADVPPEA
jgi:hypothetical protein